MASLTATVDDNGKWLAVTFEGSITETTELTADSFPTGRRVRLDVGGITSINSLGVRTWTNFLAALCDQSDQVVIRRLPPTMVSQASMVKNFLVDAMVESFFAPYCCEDCGHEELELFRTLDEIPNEFDCPECDETMFFDDLPDAYLAFRTDADVADTIAGDTPLPTGRGRRADSEETTTTY